jgi:hypothetical protein
MSGCLYLLHFTVPRFHARHYLGSSYELLNRLQSHATGQGACLTRALFEDQETWTLAAVYVPRSTCTMTIRELERLAKQRKNGSMYCPLCFPDDFYIPEGCIEFPAPHFTSEDCS